MLEVLIYTTRGLGSKYQNIQDHGITNQTSYIHLHHSAAPASRDSAEKHMTPDPGKATENRKLGILGEGLGSVKAASD